MRIRTETIRTLYAISTLKLPLASSINQLLGDKDRETTGQKLQRAVANGLLETKTYGNAQRYMYMLTLAGRGVLEAYLRDNPPPELVRKTTPDELEAKTPPVHKGYVPKAHDPRVAAPRTVSVMAGRYETPPDHHYRAGSMDYKKIPSWRNTK